MGVSSHYTNPPPQAPKIKKMTYVKKADREEEELEEKVVEDSEARKKFKDIIEKYKIRNPVKYARKKEELERKLATKNPDQYFIFSILGWFFCKREFPF